MITKIVPNTPGAQAYGQLFEEASEALGFSKEEYITSLNEYFYNLPNLIANPNFKPKYVILPVDEPMFEINANTREIKIPDAFKTGASVQGDESAEIIYFVIDRYHEAIDLNNQKIYIEWTTSDSYGASEEVFRDIESKPNYIIFGWALEKEITKNAGPVNFAIRFYTIKEKADNSKELEYSLSTRPQTITINKGMNFDIISDTDVVKSDPEDKIKNRIKQSVLDNDPSVVISPPGLLLNTAPNDRVILGESGEFVAYVQAYSPDGGQIYYYNNHDTNFDGEIDVSNELNKENGGLQYFVTEDTTRKAHKTYYIKDSNGNYSTYTAEELPLDQEELANIYELKAVCKATGVGTYSLIVKNRASKREESIVTTSFTVPRPLAPVFNTTTQHLTIEDIDDASLELSVLPAANHNPGDFTDDEGTVSYQWYNNASGNAIEGAVASTYVVYEPISCYVKLTNTLNKSSETSTEQCNYIVTYPPAKLFPYEDEEDNMWSLGETINLRIADANNSLTGYDRSDKCIVTWYKTASQTQEISDNDSPITTMVVDKNNPNCSYKPEASGYYYVRIKNEYNTFSTVTISGTEEDGIKKANYAVA